LVSGGILAVVTTIEKVVNLIEKAHKHKQGANK